MSDAVVPTTPPAAAGSNFPAQTVDRLESVLSSLLKLRSALPVGDFQTVIDGIIPDILAAMREIQTGPSLMDQFYMQISMDLARLRAEADAVARAQRDKADADLSSAALSVFLPLTKTGGGAA